VKDQRRLVAAIAAFALLTTLACAHPVERRDWSDFEGPGAEYLQAEGVLPPVFPEPVEPWNRSVDAFNHGLMLGVVAPLASGYRFVVPKVVRRRIQKFAVNLVYPRRLMANLLQGRGGAAGTETLRFLTNTTVGVLGFFDPASHWGIGAPPEEDFGQVFANWGWERSTFVNLPFAGPATVRDGLGLIPDTLLDPAAWFFPAGPMLSFNELTDFVEFYRRFTGSNRDPYFLYRLLWLINRERVTFELSSDAEDTAAVQTLEAVFLAPRDPTFASGMRTHTVQAAAEGEELPYSARMQPAPAPLVFVVPGLGTHRMGGGALALAEMAFDQGYSVAVISNAMNFEFMERGASVPVPGHSPRDAADVHRALDAIFHDLSARHPDRITSRALLGYSLGAFHALFIAAGETDPSGQWIDFDGYVALDPPVRLLHGLNKLDGFFNVLLRLPPEERDSAMVSVLHKAIGLAQQAPGAPEEEVYSRWELADLGSVDMWPHHELPVTNLQAEFLIGMAFRLSLLDIIYASQEREDLGVLLSEHGWFRRHARYREIMDYSFAEYLFAFVVPYYCERLETLCDADELIRQNDLHAIAPALRRNPRIRHFANENDFLTSGEDVAWLTELLGPERVRFFPRGGHLGNLHRPGVQRQVTEALAELVPIR
jgi:ABC-type transporter lipoprotein component MlaA